MDRASNKIKKTKILWVLLFFLPAGIVGLLLWWDDRKCVKQRDFSDIRSEIGEALGGGIVQYILETINQFID